MTEARFDAVYPIAAGGELPPEVGGKALGLRLIARAGLEVPAAWAVLPGAGATELGALAKVLEARGLRALAVRSSAADEDGARASFAGVHETALGVPPARLREAVAAVAASALSERALAYRRQLGLRPPRGGCAVVVQEMVDAEAAGVAFGRGAGEVTIEAAEGLGDAVVNGECVPETLVMRRDGEGWQLVRRGARDQVSALRHGVGGPARVAIEDARRRSAVLSAGTAAAIAAGVSALEAAAGGPLDVEWAVAGGRVSFLQARPQTRPVAAGLAPGETWTRANVRETTPELPCAFTRAFLVDALDRGARMNLRGMGTADDPAVPYASAVHGRIVLNERTFLEHGAALGLGEAFRAWSVSLAGGTGGANEIPQIDLRVVLRHPVAMVRTVIWAGRAEASARRYLASIAGSRAARRQGPGGSDASEADLASRIRANPFLSDSDRWIVAQSRLIAAVANGNMLAGALLRRPDAAALIPRLLEGAERSVSTRQIDDLVSIALAFRAWPGGARFLEDPPIDPGRWRAALPPDLSGALARWLAACGHRGPFESDLSSPRYREDGRLLATALRPMVAAAQPPEAPESRRLRNARRWEETWAEVVGVLPRLRRARLRGVLRSLGRVMALRERFRSELMMDCAELRDDLRALGRRWAGEGRLETGDDVFHLEPQELSRALEDRGVDLRAAVRRELARRAAWRRVELPNRFASEELDRIAARGLGALADGDGDALKGTAVSPGVAEAQVCVLRAPEEGTRMPTGAVLVAPATDPGWTPLFARASAVVVEVGGLFSHAATVAREYGLPAVSNVDGATDRLRDGDVVRVDGARGVVAVVSRAARTRC
jgi:pyruvate,water dikinase